MVKSRKLFFATECCPKPAKDRIFNVLSSVWKQKVPLGGTMLASVLKMSHQQLAPCEDVPLLFKLSPHPEKKPKKQKPDFSTQCFLHREMLVSKALGDEMKKVLFEATKND